MEFRAILSDVAINEQGNALATLSSVDNYGGEEGRHYIGEPGMSMHTSAVLGFDVVEGQLVMKTLNSNYLIEGGVVTYPGLILDMQKSLSEYNYDDKFKDYKAEEGEGGLPY